MRDDEKKLGDTKRPQDEKGVNDLPEPEPTPEQGEQVKGGLTPRKAGETPLEY